MVSIVGYTPEQLIVIAVLCYIFAFSWWIASVMHDILEEGSMKRSWFVLAAAIVVSVVVIVLPMRIGTVAFVDGMFFALTISEVKNVFSLWNPFSMGSSVSEEVEEVEVLGE